MIFLGKYLKLMTLGPQPAANRPGKSKHEYGFAMDIIRSNDETRLENSLESQGWARTVVDEGWHWECIGASSYNVLENYIESTMSPLSELWALTLSTFYEKRRERIKLLTTLESLRSDYAQIYHEVESLHKEIADKKNYINSENIRLRETYNKIAALGRDIDRLQERKANRQYTYCPNLRSYNKCTHTSRKQRYDNEARRLEREIISRRERRLAKSREYDASRQTVIERQRLLMQKQALWRSKSRSLQKLRREIASLLQDIRARQMEMQNARGESTRQLSEILNRVSAWS